MENEAAKILKRERQKQYPDLEKFAEVTGYSKHTVISYETGDRRLSDRAVERFAKALNLTFRVEKHRFLNEQPV